MTNGLEFYKKTFLVTLIGAESCKRGSSLRINQINNSIREN